MEEKRKFDFEATKELQNKLVLPLGNNKHTLSTLCKGYYHYIVFIAQ